ncbi:MAG: 3-isopropylmalate dehydratase small subunit [Nitrososphaerales archaeon]|nr:3-isopropylmalate dehydratase small subunit [Nitrososphaerales archaeon]
MFLKGRVWKLSDNIDTDVIIPYKYKARSIDPKELAEHCLEGIDPEFSRKVQKGDLIVAGRNFGCGSSRDQAPIAIKASGISAVIAESFARIFYRNAINIGLPAIVCKGISKETNEGDIIEIDLGEGTVKNIMTGKSLKADKHPEFLEKMLEAGGLVEYYKKFGKFPWE